MFGLPEFNLPEEFIKQIGEQILTEEKSDSLLSNKNSEQEANTQNIEDKTDMQPSTPTKREKRKIMSIKEDDIANMRMLIDLTDNQFEKITDKNLRKILIKGNKGRVVAHAKWKNGDIVVSKIRRPSKTLLEKGQILYELDPYGINEPWPEAPELKTEGWQLYCNKDYNNKQAIRKDPYWENYQGWFAIPEKINEKNGMETLLKTYPELDKMGYEVKKSVEVDSSKLKMVRWKDMDAYVCGQSEEIPELIDFEMPKEKEMICYSAATCHCGCGRFEHWYLYYPNKWIICEPREK